LAVLSISVGRRRKFEVSCTECTGQQNDLELIPTAQMETRNPVEGYFGSEFRRSVIIAELWRPEVARHYFLELFAFFEKTLKKRPLTVKFSKFSSESLHRDTDRRVVFNFVKFGRREIGEIVRCLPDKKQNFASLSTCRYYADRAQYLPWPAPDNVLRLLQISSKSVHFRRRSPPKRSVK